MNTYELTNEERNAWIKDRANQYLSTAYKLAAREARFIRAMDTLQAQGFVTSIDIEERVRYRLTEKGKEFFNW